VVFIVFGLEHALILLSLLITSLVPSVPGWVKTEEARRSYVSERATRRLLLRSHSSASQEGEEEKEEESQEGETEEPPAAAGKKQGSTTRQLRKRPNRGKK
jgi:type II secretory pathway pseudopilin PulG